MTHHVVDGFDLGYLDAQYMRLQLQNQGFPVDDNMINQNQMDNRGSLIHGDMLPHNQTADGGFQTDSNMFSQDHMEDGDFQTDSNMFSQEQIADGGFHIDGDRFSQSQMNNGDYAIDNDFEMTDAQTMDGTVSADGTFSSHEENRADAADNDIEMSDESMMDDVISADNTISPQGENGENKVGDDAGDNAIIAAPAPNDHMTQCRIMFLAFNPPPAVPIDPSQRNMLRTAPIEIRHMIYEICLPEPRTVNFDLINSPRSSRQQEYKCTIPGIFRVDRDSRAYWNMKYITINKPHYRAMHKFYGTRNPMPLIFNPKIDTASITFLNKIPAWGYNETKEWLRHVQDLLPNGFACVRVLDIREVSTKGPTLNDSDLQACFFRTPVWNDNFWTWFRGLEKLYFTASNVGSQGKRKLREPDFARLKDFVLSYRASGVALGIQNPIPSNKVVVRSFVPA
ncbi:uncharacterized protein Bfra_011744 [Botrytis fragariae]|uniref:2EXR domain-containing protein n=1 Tax=Botrytis fragariae TaxID=1964551 RepID=A0A8H6AKB5_9HELO|nr:uncharacterized protein Bfra_011744 [Botrytis fragariae]KAF5869201.1 hypothetical protein Bfra_011744 [Botrytis fragariae]